MPTAFSVPELTKQYAAAFARRRNVSREVAEIRLHRMLNIIVGCLRVGESIALTPSSSGESKAMVIVTRATGNRLMIETKEPLREAQDWWKKLNRPQSGMHGITRAFAERG